MQSIGCTREGSVEEIAEHSPALVAAAAEHHEPVGSCHGSIEREKPANHRATTAPRIERRPLAVLLADVVGYSRLIEADDLDTALRIRSLRRHLIGPTVTTFGGRIVDAAGDGALAAFPVVSDALLCAAAIHQELEEQERHRPMRKRLRLRMGVSAGGEVLVIDGELYGSAVNIAARLLALAAPGEVFLSGHVFDRLAHDIMARCESLGRRRLRNIARWVRIYRLSPACPRCEAMVRGHEADVESRTLNLDFGNGAAT